MAGLNLACVMAGSARGDLSAATAEEPAGGVPRGACLATGGHSLPAAPLLGKAPPNFDMLT